VSESRLCITWGCKRKTEEARNAPGVVHYDILLFNPSCRTRVPSSSLHHSLQRTAERIAKSKQAVRGNHGQGDGHRLPEADGAGKRRAAEDDRCEETQLDAVGLVVRDAVAAEAVWRRVPVISAGLR